MLELSSNRSYSCSLVTFELKTQFTVESFCQIQINLYIFALFKYVLQPSLMWNFGIENMYEICMPLTFHYIQPLLTYSLLFLLLSCPASALPFPLPLSPCLHCLFALFNRRTNMLWHVPIAHRHHCCQQPQKATFSLALLPLPACSHSDSPRKQCICHRLWLMALLIAVLGHHHTYTFCF